MIENLYRGKLQIENSCHDGQGDILNYRIYDKGKTLFQVDFIDFVVVPPGASIGNHVHGNNMETYIIIRGNGTMRFENKDFPVESGDILVNKSFGEHGLINNSSDDILLLVFEVSDRG
jgi:mannose-6-phosphate isomerase-like protein (cupin superfamily)